MLSRLRRTFWGLGSTGLVVAFAEPGLPGARSLGAMEMQILRESGAGQWVAQCVDDLKSAGTDRLGRERR